MSSSTAADRRDWANLPSDLLGSIAGRLYVPDYIRFGSVCTSWRSAAPPPNRGGAGGVGPFSPRMPYLLTADYCTLLNIADGSVQRIAPLPEISGKWCVGSRDGWLALLDEFSNVSLLNPLTRSQIQLPLITTLPFIEPLYDDSDGSLSAYRFHEELIWGDAEGPTDQSIKQFRTNSIHKVILSSDPALGTYTVVAIFHYMKLILFIRPGEDEWNLLDERGPLDDVICRKDGTFLAVAEVNGEVFALDFSCEPPRKSVFAEGIEDQNYYSARYLVELSSGDLLQLCRCSEWVEEGHMSLVESILIMRLDPKKATWSPLRSLGEHSLFVGNNYSISLSAMEIPSLKCNCVYFTNKLWEVCREDLLEITHAIGVYNAEDGSVRRFDHPWLQWRWPPPIWITPTPW